MELSIEQKTLDRDEVVEVEIDFYFIVDTKMASYQAIDYSRLQTHGVCPEYTSQAILTHTHEENL